MSKSASTPVVSFNGHVTAAAYLMKRVGAAALVVLDGQWPSQSAGIITKADIAQTWRSARTWTAPGSATCSW